VTYYATGNTSSGAAAPTSYTYQLNGDNPVTVAVGSSSPSPYQAQIKVVPTRAFNTLTVTATAADGMVGQSEPCDFIAAPRQPPRSTRT
jgi:hypothetical protein